MPKIDKKTFKVLPRTNIQIYKFENKQTYFCRFYIGRIHNKSGRFEKSLKTKSTNLGNISQWSLHFGFTRSNLKAKVKQHLGQGIACLRDCLRTPDAAVKGSDVNAAYR